MKRLLRSAVVLVAAIIFADRATADPPVSFPPNTELDANDSVETEYSMISQEFIVPAIGGQIDFDWQIFSTEFFLGGGAEDVFYARLVDVASGTVLDEINGALDPTPSGYTGTFAPIGMPPLGATAPSYAAPGGAGLMFEAFHVIGGTAWTSSTLTFEATDQERTLALEFLVADSADRGADTSLAIDAVEAHDVTGLPIATLANGGFEAHLADWSSEGNVGVYETLLDLITESTPVAGTGATEGKTYALISTAGSIPEPGSLSLTTWAGLAFCRRRRRSA